MFRNGNIKKIKPILHSEGSTFLMVKILFHI